MMEQPDLAGHGKDQEKKNIKRKRNSRQTYDQVFWASLNCLPKYIPALINELFDRQYTEQAVASFESGKQVTDRPEQGLTTREVDSMITVSENTEKHSFHVECETHGKRTIALRIVQYASGHAAQNASMIEDGAVLKIPSSAVIFLRSDSARIDHLTIWIEYPEGRVSYKVPVIRIENYSIEDMFNKKLILLIPFAAFKFSDADFARMNTGDARPIQEMIEKISVHLNELVNANALESWERTNLWHYFNEVFSCLASKYSNIMKGVDQVMKHKLFVTEVDRIRQASIEQGQNDIWGAIDYLYLHGRENEIQTITKDKELRKQIVAEYKTAMQAQQVSG